tara:strand:- start:870 stop:1454 length:585 start_codon:yes stop_codon:yes gene_type:complete
MCPSKFFCLNKDTLILLIIGLIIVVIFYINKNNSKFITLSNNINENKVILENKMTSMVHIQQPPMDPRLAPPLRKLSVDMNQPGIPINVHTRGEPTGYQQVGVLMDNASGGDGKLLPLYGQETYSGSKQWNYYTSSDGYQSVKLGVVQGNKNCQEHYGCKEIYDGDSINVNGYNNQFKANVYKLQVPRYIPHII